jgi:hypothetical protein
MSGPGLRIRGSRLWNREPFWQPDRTAQPRTTTEAHRAQTAVLSVKADPLDQAGRLVETYRLEGWGSKAEYRPR